MSNQLGKTQPKNIIQLYSSRIPYTLFYAVDPAPSERESLLDLQ
jgi:hypothetical protein